MGCGNSKNMAADRRAEAAAYQKRKKMGFKDPGLEDHRKACVKQKKRLRHVEDPDKKRKQKVQQIQKKQTTAKRSGPRGATTTTTSGGGATAHGGGGVTQADILAARSNLKRRK